MIVMRRVKIEVNRPKIGDRIRVGRNYWTKRGEEMEAYKQRMIKEYRELKERAEKLATMLDKWDKGTLDFAPACPKYLLDKQLETMQEYAGILQTRAKLEDVDLNASVDDAPVLVTVARQLDGDKFVTMAFTMNGHWSCFDAEITAWVPAARELPNDLQEVNVLFVNHNPPSYYANMKDIQQTGCAVFYDGKWFWYTPTARDFLAEYQRCPDLEMDKNIEVIAWAPIPDPPKGEDSK